MDAPRLPNGRIDWDTILRRYGTDMDMSYALTLKWASERDSLQAIAELVGFSVIGGAHGQQPSSQSKDLLNSLGTYLHSKGYKVPSMWAPASAETYIAKGREPRLPTERERKVSKAKQTVVTREKYLDMRLSGMNRTQCGKELGVSSPTLYRRLAEWGLREPEAEELLLAAMQKLQRGEKGPLSIELGVTTVQDKPANECYVTLRIPVAVVEWPEQVRALSEKVLDRDMMIRVGVTCLQNAAAWAHRDLVDILGDEAVTQRLQAFMERKCGVAV